MERFSGGLFVLVFMMLVSTAVCKDLHTKDKDTSGEKTLVINLLTNDEVYTKHERYIRHVNLPTESASSHILSQIKGQVSPKDRSQSQNNALKKLINNLRKRLKKYVRSKKGGKKPKNNNNNTNNKST